jgi:large subunit ribosomal protein L25
MKTYTLNAQKRDALGRKVKKLRAQGMLPASIYGKKVPSESVVLTLADFASIYKDAGVTGLVDLTIDGKKKPVLIHHVQKDPVSEAVLHVEFYQVDLKEKVHAKVPVVLVGESKAVADHKGVILSLLSEVEVEALPAELPENIEVDVTQLAEIDQELKVSDLPVAGGVTILTDATVTVVKVGELVSKAAEEQAAQEEAAAAEVAEEAKGDEKTEAATPAAEAKPSEEKKE